MNKLALTGTTVVLAAVLAGSVWADPSLSQVKEVSDAEWIDGSNLLKMEDEEGYFIADIDGTALTKS